MRYQHSVRSWLGMLVVLSLLAGSMPSAAQDPADSAEEGPAAAETVPASTLKSPEKTKSSHNLETLELSKTQSTHCDRAPMVAKAKQQQRWIKKSLRRYPSEFKTQE